HDFRPDYLRLGDAVSSLGLPQVCGFTATATPMVREDIARNLNCPGMEPYVTGFQRPNLAFSVLECRTKGDKRAALERLLQEPAPTIIYASTRKNAEEVAAQFDAICYHAGLPDRTRAAAQDRFMNDPCPILVATNAFGMGIDRSDIRRVIHYNLPGSLEAYYQEAGRAGRDGTPAKCVLLSSYQDRFVQEFLIDLNNPPVELLQTTYDIVARRAVKGAPVALERLPELVPGGSSAKQVETVVRVLEKFRVVERVFSHGRTGTLRFLKPSARLRETHAHCSTQRSFFIHRCIGHLGGRADGPIAITVEELGWISGLGAERTERVLEALQGSELDWQPPVRGEVVQPVDPSAKTLELDLEELRRKRAFDLERLELVMQYTRGRDCRQRVLIGYFGQELGSWRCGTCDRCCGGSDSLHAAREPTGRERVILRTILEACLELRGRIGRGKLALLLGGSRAEQMTTGYRLVDHPRHGALSTLSQPEIRKYIDALQTDGYLAETGDPKYPCIDISRQGSEVLEGSVELTVSLPAPTGEGRASKAKRARGVSVSEAPLTEEDGDLLGHLRTLRAEMAEKKGVPVYHVLTNASLEQFARVRPVTVEEALKIKGVGPVKARTIVPKFLEAIAQRRHDTIG
ncbi:MAG: HRDC domain-containing protein, partial [Lentisphaeria bacterium]|nr:HRDC domain-containing protein [Lentisphaeria bacterium]